MELQCFGALEHWFIGALVMNIKHHSIPSPSHIQNQIHIHIHIHNWVQDGIV